MKDEALKLALYALKLGDTVFYPQTSIAIAAIEAALAQQEPDNGDELTIAYMSGVHRGKELAAQPAQEPEYRCCPHDSDCAVHNMPAYPAGQCDCSYSNKFNLPPSAQIHEICLKLIERELDKLTNENFGRTPNDAWANKIVDVYHFFDSNPKAKKLTEIYTTPQQRPWVGLTEAQFLEATRLAENGNYLVAFVRIQEWLKEKNT
jgi:hypothetical protein